MDYTCEHEDLDNCLEEIKIRYEKESRYICEDLQKCN